LSYHFIPFLLAKSWQAGISSHSIYKDVLFAAGHLQPGQKEQNNRVIIAMSKESPRIVAPSRQAAMTKGGKTKD
jgi:hypothetical protein